MRSDALKSPPPLSLCHAVLAACAQAKRYATAFEMLRRMLGARVPLDEPTRGLLADLFDAGDLWKQVATEMIKVRARRASAQTGHHTAPTGERGRVQGEGSVG